MDDTAEPPWPPLAGCVTRRSRHWYQIGLPHAGPRRYALYPDGLAQLVIGHASGPLVLGPRARLRTFGLDVPTPCLGVPTPCLGVHMTPRVAHALLGQPMNRLAGAVAELSDVAGAVAEGLVRALGAAWSWPSAFALADRFLGERLAGYVPEADAVTVAWRLLVRAAGRMTVAELAERTGMSERLLELRFREQIGLSPKTSARVLRLRYALRLLATGRPAARVATECGFYDQAHLNHDCKALTGRRPSSIAGAGGELQRHLAHFGFVQDWLAGLDDHDEGG
ncbi:helix-turn-helix domain-containing protein [Nonomuraea sp. NPDC050783]|uniref:helix-turn-helix domain-containing protein n=1 Tax=Nonomuraea sp. NPDC050783 TaxID=3154634 RepID=UPI00346786FB